jgi:hypothetical protein
MLHQERDGITAFAAAKTFENFFGGRNRERWRSLVVKGTVAQIVGAAFFQLDKRTDDFNNIEPRKDLLYGVLCDQPASNIGDCKIAKKHSLKRMQTMLNIDFQSAVSSLAKMINLLIKHDKKHIFFFGKWFTFILPSTPGGK